MEFGHDTHAFGPSRGVEVEAAKLIDLILVMLGEPVLRTRKSLVVFELQIGRGERKRDKSLRDFGCACRCRMVQRRRISQGKRVGSRFHRSLLNWI